MRDAELRAAGIALAHRLQGDGDAAPGAAGNGSPRRVLAGAVVGIPSGHDPGSLVASVDEQVARGFARVRVKIEPGWDAVPMAAVRRAHPDLDLHADANGAYRLDSDGVDGAGHPARLDDLGLVGREQPL